MPLKLDSGNPIYQVPAEAGALGKVFFVGANDPAKGVASTNDGSGTLAENATRGLDPSRPFLTMEYCQTNACVANRGDKVYVLPGYTESVVEAGGLDLDIAGVHWIGQGTGTSRPTLTLSTAATADIDISAANITLENFLILANVDELAGMIDVNATNFHLKNCEIRLTDATDGSSVQTIDAIVSTTASGGLTIEGCTFWGLGVAGATGGSHVLYDIGADDVTIIDNYIQGPFTSGEGAIFQDTAAGVRWQVLRNRVNNALTGATVGMSLHANTAGIKDSNIWGILAGGTPVIAAGMQWGIDREQGSVGAIATEV